MRLAYICADPEVPIFGHKGCSIHVQEVIRAFQKQGVQVELFAAQLGGNPPPDLANIPVRQLPALPQGSPESCEQAALDNNFALQLALQMAGPFDLVYERYSLWSFAGMRYAQGHQIPGFLEVNAPLIEEQAKYHNLIDRTSAELVAAQVFNSATILFAVSAEIAAYLDQRLTAQIPIYVVPNGVNPDRFPANLKLSYPKVAETFTVGFLGSLKPWQGLPVLVEAFALLHQQIPDSRLLIVGDGIERVDLVADLSARGLLEATYLTGAVAPAEVPELLALMDVAVAPYPAQPDFYLSPLKVYEYMAAGVPVVASRIGQLASLIEDGVNGILCPPGDAQALAKSIAQLHRHPQLCDRLSKAGRTVVLQHHTWDAIVQRILALSSIVIFSDLSNGEAMQQTPHSQTIQMLLLNLGQIWQNIWNSCQYFGFVATVFLAPLREIGQYLGTRI